MPGLFFLPKSGKGWPRLTWRDLIVFVGLFALLYGLVYAARQMGAPFKPSEPLRISLSPAALPAYALRSTVRMYLAYILSMVFTFIVGRVAAYNPRAERWIIPILDILQSVPALGFLAVSVTIFLVLFPHSLIGLEISAIITIFSAQAWNLTFSFYQSIKTLPKELQEAATSFQMTPWRRFTMLEVPYAMTGLVWNSMMSFGAGWFFLAASETITVLNNDYRLPGLGSYMAAAIEQENVQAIIWAVAAILTVVVLVDQLFWRPVVAWAERFRIESLPDDIEPSSVILEVLRGSVFADWVSTRVFLPIGRGLERIFTTARRVTQEHPMPGRASTLVRWAVVLGLVAWATPPVVEGVMTASRALSWSTLVHLLYLGFLSTLRVAATVAIATLIWVPVGVRVGFSPRLARIAQPIVQIGASFPANVIYPLITFGFVYFGISLNYGSILLLLLATQWYILFNTIAGAMQVPMELKLAAQSFHLKGWRLWKTLIIPAIFPGWVTGALTATGGAWNATIVAEVVTWGHNPPAPAVGLGAYITHVTQEGLWPETILSISVMSAFVVLLNHLLWQPLYHLAEERFVMSATG